MRTFKNASGCITFVASLLGGILNAVAIYELLNGGSISIPLPSGETDVIITPDGMATLNLAIGLAVAVFFLIAVYASWHVYKDIYTSYADMMEIGPYEISRLRLSVLSGSGCFLW
jgi:hypothetical protein